MRLLLLALLLVVEPAFSGDPRHCGPPVRDAAGKIARDAAVVAEFRRLHPCPSTGRATGVCPGWAVDHVLPLASCGCDVVSNMQWLPLSIKSASSPDAKDRWERRVYRCPKA